MMKEAQVKQRPMRADEAKTRAAILQRRVMRLLLLHNEQLFHGHFRTLYAGSSLADHPLIQFYDQYIRIVTLSGDLLQSILLRIYRQWSQDTEYTFVQEEDSTRGQIDWQQTVERSNHDMPGQHPLSFVKRVRQQQQTLPENLLIVAILLYCQNRVREMLDIDQRGVLLTAPERQLLNNLEDHLEHELAQADLQLMIDEAQKSDLEMLVEEVKAHLHPGSSPYHILIEWWEQFSSLQIGSSESHTRLSMSLSHTHNDQTNLSLYELWIALEFLTLLHDQDKLDVGTLRLDKDQLTFVFIWNAERYRFCYRRQGTLDEASTHDWKHVPSSAHSSYLIERDKPLVVEHKGKTIWQEPLVVVDVAYSAADLETVMQRLLGNMTLAATTHGLLISLSLAEPQSETHLSGVAAYDQRKYSKRVQETHIELFKLTPDMPADAFRERILSILQHIIAHLPKRPQPVCCGVVLDQDSSNASGITLSEFDVICPKPHIGSDIYDLVKRDKHCLKDSLLCHVIGQAILPPQVKRIMNLDDLKAGIEQLRQFGVTALKQAEDAGDEEHAEQLRVVIFERIGQAIEQYVHMRGNTAQQEKFLREGIFKEYWNQHDYKLEQATRDMLISGEYVWDDYQDASLEDWAAPAVQYCRALESETGRRFYEPVKGEFKGVKEWTLGKVKMLYNNGMFHKEWPIFARRAGVFHVEEQDLIDQFVRPMVVEFTISDLRNKLAHGERIDRKTASILRNATLGLSGRTSLLYWTAKHIGPAKEPSM